MGAGIVSAGATSTSAAIISAMGAAGFSSLCAQSAMAILSNEGHLGRAAEQLASKDSILALSKAMLAAGLVAGASQFMGTASSS